MSYELKEIMGKASTPRELLERDRESLLAQLHAVNRAIQETESDGSSHERLSLAGLRSALGWSRKQLAHVMNASDRALVNWEGGAPLSPVYGAKLREIQSLYLELLQFMQAQEIGPWLLSEMEEFEGRTPADLLSKGETGRIWASLFHLRTGMPD